jgi:hypothetical protein
MVLLVAIDRRHAAELELEAVPARLSHIFEPMHVQIHSACSNFVKMRLPDMDG